MSQPRPPWLRSSLQDSHLSFAIRTLDARETQREAARIAQSSSSNPRARISLPHFSRSSRVKDYFSCSVGQQPAHRRANRYLYIEPYNRTRVLVPKPDREGRCTGDAAETGANSRYLNANWVRETAGGKWWIGGQAPLPNSAHAFLTLGMCPVAPPPTSSKSSLSPIGARRVQTIVQLTQLVEGGRRRAHPYFSGSGAPQDMIIAPEPECDSPPIHIHVTSEETVNDAHCVRTELRLRWGSSTNRRVAEEWTVTHLLYTGWPDFGVPEDNQSILNFARLVERVNNRDLDHTSDDPNSSPPILVHCSAGVGRTGSFIALCSLLRAHSLLSSLRKPSSSTLTTALAPPPLPVSPLGPLPNALSEDLVAREIDGLREQRASMVQREEQAIWVYEALGHAFEGV